MYISTKKQNTTLKLPVIWSLGFFAIAAQTLLFRDFLTVFKGSELSIGLFFFSWLIWVAIGAFISRKLTQTIFLNNFELLPLLYLPAFIIQQVLIVNSRVLMGIQPFELYPLIKMIPFGIVSCAPVSFLTGIFFPLGCKWISKERFLPVTVVYASEVLGSFIGGITITLLLTIGITKENLFFICSVILALSLLPLRIKKKRYITAILPVFIFFMLFVLGFGSIWSFWNNESIWKRLLPKSTFTGSYLTPAAKYLYGKYKDQLLVMSWGTVCESYPDDLYGAEVASLHLVQNPEAKKVLILGQGALSVCRVFLKLKHIEKVTWVNPDIKYAKKLIDVLPAQYKKELSRLELPEDDIYSVLSEGNVKYDLILIQLPDASTLSLNRYYTKEFYKILKKHLSKSGVLSVSTKGNENYLGSELVHLGASVYVTLKSCFNNIVIKPGDSSWLIASDRHTLNHSPRLLERNFLKIDGLAEIFPFQGIQYLYQEDKILFQLSKYNEELKKNGHKSLLNTSDNPKAMLFSLLLSIKQATGSDVFLNFINMFGSYGTLIFIIFILIFTLCRYIYRKKTYIRILPEESINSSAARGFCFDRMFLLFSQGVIAISTNILLIFLYQEKFGSIFLHLGLISALFMVGLFTGSVAIRWIFRSIKKEPKYFLVTIILIHVIFLLFIYFIRDIRISFIYIILFFTSGVISGLYIPVVAFRQEITGENEYKSGSLIELSDHLGGSAGSIASGLIMFPVLGVISSLSILSLFLLSNLIPELESKKYQIKKKTLNFFSRLTRPIGYILFGIAIFILFLSLTNKHFQSQKVIDISFFQVASNLAKGRELEARKANIGEGVVISYFRLKNKDSERDAYIFNTGDFVKDIYGYGGPIEMVVVVNDKGELERFIITKSNETPAYIEYVYDRLKDRLKDKNIFKGDLREGIDTITGATMTCDAIILSIAGAAKTFAYQVLGMNMKGEQYRPNRWKITLIYITFFIFLVSTLILRRNPVKWWRQVYLLLLILAIGIILNMQYSTAALFSSFLFFQEDMLLSLSILFALGIPLIVILFGNIFCGYLCPFGAIQELIGDIRPPAISTDIDRNILRYTRYLKYILLFYFVVLFAWRLDSSVFSMDPLTFFFSFRINTILFIISIAIIILSFFFKRFYCRSICPAGAFLSFLGQIKLIRFFVPRIFPQYCDYGVTNHTDLDCIQCDRCRIYSKLKEKKEYIPEVKKKPKWIEIAFILIVIIFILIIIFFTMISSSKVKTPLPASESVNSSGVPIDADIKKLEDLIKKGKLSDHEALYYKQID